LYGNYEHWRAKGAWQTEADFSDGTLRLMGLLWALLDGTGPLLLEEPELSLHPEIVRHIPQMMLRVQRGREGTIRQVLLSTHSSDLLRDEGIAADEVLLFIPSEEGSEVKVCADLADVCQLLEAGLSVAEAVIPRTQPKKRDPRGHRAPPGKRQPRGPWLRWSPDRVRADCGRPVVPQRCRPAFR